MNLKLTVHISKTNIVDFHNDDLKPYFPAIKASINKQDCIVRLDTGASYIIMSEAHIKQFGVKTKPDGKGYHGRKLVDRKSGSVTTFQFGNVILENVPVTVLPTVKHIIFGTNILKQFHSTVDYPNHRLIVTPKGNIAELVAHENLLKGTKTSVPFELHGTHYMTAVGSVGNIKDVRFFIDSGLVALKNDGKTTRQAALTGLNASDLKKLNIQLDELGSRQFIDRNIPISLGELTQNNHLLWWEGENANHRKFNTHEIHGLLGHAFLSKYAWTLDFQKMTYTFTSK